eukprot:CAMPEP_0195508030 /NCGR_PEP_ID=MMETSP0794_2-20130614/1341_1 /TAXON_ID=515487 /ORGANISM="Stephanopyxis turris, Strain CCMP 815" /LENGTH=253 /DNA_ID=CAMNT_0040634881 /DNA_START=280 /DNA_END=1038 /DNA_ORIENTATION=+
MCDRFTSATAFFYKMESDSNEECHGDVFDKDNIDIVQIPPELKQPVLRQVYPALLASVKEYGHSDIPLGTTDGRKCSTLRRLKMQGKLSEAEIDILVNLNFRFVSFDNIYYEADFDTLLKRLIQYEETHKVNYQIPKKYQPDMELGAWVTMIRRIGARDLPQEQVDKLNEINFAWVSTRKCGSQFMKGYQALRKWLEKVPKLEDSAAAAELIKSDPDTTRWLIAQQKAHKKGNLSEHRVQYMDDITEEFKLNW